MADEYGLRKAMYKELLKRKLAEEEKKNKARAALSETGLPKPGAKTVGPGRKRKVTGQATDITAHKTNELDFAYDFEEPLSYVRKRGRQRNVTGQAKEIKRGESIGRAHLRENIYWPGETITEPIQLMNEEEEKKKRKKKW